MLANLRRDSERYASLRGWLRHPGFWIVAVYRLGAWAHSLRNPLLRLAMWLVYRMAKLPFGLFSVELWAGSHGARVGPGLCLIHPANVVIGRGVEIGEDCLIFHDVTIGTGPIPGVPKIGNQVDIYVGARVLGGIVVGDRCMIGANCVVVSDVPAGSVVVAPPSRVIPRSLSRFARAAERAGGG
jgi:serine O-acetyltransferase